MHGWLLRLQAGCIPVSLKHARLVAVASGRVYPCLPETCTAGCGGFRRVYPCLPETSQPPRVEGQPPRAATTYVRTHGRCCARGRAFWTASYLEEYDLADSFPFDCSNMFDFFIINVILLVKNFGNREGAFCFLSYLKEYDPGDSFPLDCNINLLLS